MKPSHSAVFAWLSRRAENISAALLAAVFLCFLLQIAFRYLLNWPVGWTLEVSTLAWMWLVLWGSAFIVKEPDDIRFDILYSSVPARLRRWFVVATGLPLVVLFAVTLPAAYDYVTFMKVERASYIGVRLDFLFSVYLLFSLAVILRFSLRVWRALKREDPDLAASGD